MHIITSLKELSELTSRKSESIGLVPTMGALHEGHLSLVESSVKENEHTVVSIFVNPTQFGPNEDFNKYPRTLEADAQLLSKFGERVSIFTPEPGFMYPGTSFISFEINKLGSVLEGKIRPGHFAGVLQVVAKLFHLVRPKRAYFGAKDFQQTVVIRRMIDELFFPVEMIVCPTVRDADGLALSSRNRYLSEGERKNALILSRLLFKSKELARSETEPLRLRNRIWDEFSAQNEMIPDYFEIVSDIDLSVPEKIDDHSYAVIAGRAGATRLLDNLKLL